VKRVRAFEKNSEENKQFLGIIEASDLSDATRHDHDLRCLSCSAAFHWVDQHRILQNTKVVSAHFRRNRSSSHEDGCAYDYEVLAKKNKDVVFLKNGIPHLRINFAIGSSFTDRYPQRGQLTRQQRAAASQKSNIKSVGSLNEMINFLEKEYETLENEALENLVLEYQGRAYPFGETFIRSDDYTSLFNAAADRNKDNSDGKLVAVRPVKEISRNQKNKRRFECEWQHGSTGSRREKIKPIIVCETDSVAQKIAKAANSNEPAVIASRPFISQQTLNNYRRPNVPIYLYAHNHKQIEPVDNKYWRYSPGRQTNLALDF
jgi:hypothetical protein